MSSRWSGLSSSVNGAQDAPADLRCKSTGVPTVEESEIQERLRRVEADMKRAVSISRIDYRVAMWAGWTIAFCLGLAAAACVRTR